MIDPIASALRRVARQVERVNRRIALLDLPGKVIPGSQTYSQEDRSLRLDLGRSADGRVIKSPKARWQEPGAGTLKIHGPPKDEEQMRLRSASGTVGTGSEAHWATYDDDNGPPSTKGDEAVLEFGGKSKITMKADRIELAIGESTIVMTADVITTTATTVVTKADDYQVNP